MRELRTDPNGRASDAVTDPTASEGGDRVAGTADDLGVMSTAGVGAKEADSEIPPLPRPLPARVAKLAGRLLSSPNGSTVARVPERPTVPGYEILDKIARGGMGVVYRARHVKLNGRHRPGGGHLRAGRHPVRDVHWPTAVPGRDTAGHVAAGRER